MEGVDAGELRRVSVRRRLPESYPSRCIQMYYSGKNSTEKSKVFLAYVYRGWYDWAGRKYRLVAHLNGKRRKEA